MRKAMWFTIGFAASCGLCTWFLRNQYLLYFVLTGFVCGFASGFFRNKNILFRVVSVVSYGVAVGFLWISLFHHVYIQPIVSLDGETVSLSITATDYSEQTQYSVAVHGLTKISGKLYRVRVYLNEDYTLSPGDHLEGSFYMKVTTPGSANQSDYYQGIGVYLIASQRGEGTLTRTNGTPIWLIPTVAAENARQMIAKFFPKDTAPFAEALLLGDTDGLTYEQDTALKISGIRHIVAVSGLHVGFIFALIVLFVGHHRIWTPVVAIPLMLFFAAAVGFTPSITRACAMTAIMIIGFSLMEEYDGLTSLSAAAFGMMLTNPYVISSVSFQLSVSSVAGILLFFRPIYQWFWKHYPNIKPRSRKGKILSWIGTSFSVSAGALVFTTPLSAMYFGSVSLVGILANLLTIWMVGVIFCGVVLIVLLGGFLPGVCGFGAAVVSVLIRYVLGISKLLANIPFAAVYTQSIYICIWLVVCYILIALFVLFRKYGKLYIGIAIVGLCLALGLSCVLPRLDSVRMSVLSVGEGQSILLQSKGQTVLIDCGGDSDVEAANIAAQTLLSQGIRELDALALTHYDRDHSGAVDNLLSRIDVDTLFLPVMGDNRMETLVKSHSESEIQYITQGISIPFGEGTLTFSSPDSGKTTNENCMCVLFESSNCVILITGDRNKSGEKRLLETMDIPDVDILVAGHHGSKTSTSEELLRAAKPEIVIISVGADNSYGHPSEEVLTRLDTYGCTVYRTDLDGTVVVRR